MRSGLWLRLDHVARSLWPFALTVALVILSQVPLRITLLSPVLPSLALIAVYYWSIHRPDLMPIWAVFLIGLFQDLLGGGPAGVGILTLLAVHAVVTAQRRFFASASFVVIWLVFALVALAAQALAWLLVSALAGAVVEPRPATFQILLTIAVYPCLAWGFAQAQRAIVH